MKHKPLLYVPGMIIVAGLILFFALQVSAVKQTTHLKSQVAATPTEAIQYFMTALVDRNALNASHHAIYQLFKTAKQQYDFVKSEFKYERITKFKILGVSRESAALARVSLFFVDNGKGKHVVVLTKKVNNQWYSYFPLPNSKP
ncbi:MAG: hypothetical protein ACYCVB_19175 [Bacilli bacterium]